MKLPIITTPPDFTGPGGRAWIVPTKDYPETTVACWCVEAPWAHMLWHSYMISLVTLKDVEGMPPAIVHVPGATHEMVVMALDPEVGRQPFIDGGKPSVLTPPNFAAQRIYSSDAEAIADIQVNAVAPILAMQLSPDTDHMSQWVARFGDSMVRK